MNILNYFFGNRKKPKVVFIVEDNDVYAKALAKFIKDAFPDVKDVRTYDGGEVALAELHHDPHVIIMDHFLGSDQTSTTGLETIRKIRDMKPKTNIMLLSSQNEIGVALEATKKYRCHYIRKDSQAFDKVGQYMKKVL